ncbi:CHAT domain-containing protein [Kamptonema animale CS-326]|uniref:CHAT domain-containing protein n=1 Tax=Kamptonema animale TaxID=92934 RepID=UPI00232ED905|nr:CHAT domain-containing protein [Kamptonema animale]MDB9509691.1 CHAT domain-containing protein [Kamptonema animale CS-326]
MNLIPNLAQTGIVNPTPAIAPVPAPSSPFPLNLEQQNQISTSLEQGNSRSPFSPIEIANLPINPGAVVFPQEERFTRDFVEYLSLPSPSRMATLQDAQNTLAKIQEATGIKPAIIYVSFMPKGSTTYQPENTSSILRVDRQVQPSDELEMLIVTSKGDPIRKRISGTTRAQVLALAQDFRTEITNPRKRNTTSYLPLAQQLYKLIVAPLEADLQAQGIENLSFIADTGLRSIPMAALHDGKGFLIERYSVGQMPSLSLTDTRFVNIKNSQVLAMGASQFVNLSPLPAVPVELSTITPQLWEGKSFLNEGFTLANLKGERQQQPYPIVHLATHAEFQGGVASNSYIQLWDTKLRLDQLRQLGWNNPPVELLVLSACKTAVGDEEAELGFAGLAVQGGVKSAVASLWYVSDEGTLGLMTEFYQQLRTAPIKAKALQKAQIAMIRGQVRIDNGKLHTASEEVLLPSELVATSNDNLSHPYYWAAFRMIGNPW